ncbi:hypothetical protein TSUD_129790 [Trifolium subterraneum]|uniref:Uncharacterized protein n=1 Tax=Trifolium subterraneum TaxID=3900 RepID=A0A2Z6N0V5_TRISU|nr:hypothetical protein TSUD_129790 [Trifolium subterraneum]
MREEREERRDRKEGDYEGDPPKNRREGYYHQIDMEITPFFFTNFPEDAIVDELWSRFVDVYGFQGLFFYCAFVSLVSFAVGMAIKLITVDTRPNSIRFDRENSS